MSRLLALSCGACFTLVAGASVLARPVHDLAPVTAATRQLIDDHGLDGASVRLVKGTQEVYRRHFDDYDADTRVALASASKWLSALALARLVEKGTLRWDSQVGEYFPDAPLATRDITLTQLFSHTSGIGIEDAGCLSDRATPLQACARQILAQPLGWAPGTAFAYGGNSMQVAGAMAEIAAGKSWDAVFVAEVVQPLGLPATDWSAGALRSGYVPNPNPRIGGGARSTLDDYGVVLDMVLAGGVHDGLPYLSMQTIATMAQDRTVGLAVASSPVGAIGYGYGFGQWVEYKDPSGATLRVSSPGAFGFTPWVDWVTGSNGIIMVQGPGWQMRDDLTELERLALRQLDDVEYLQSTAPGKPRAQPDPPGEKAAPVPGRSPGQSPAPAPARSPGTSPARLDGGRRAH